MCYKNGGGAFLIPFAIFMILVGVPVMYLELAVGQFTSRGPILSWVMTPLFKGVGISMNWINNYVNIYYIMLLSYSLYYFVLSLNSSLPWEKCNSSWGSISKYTPEVNINSIFKIQFFLKIVLIILTALYLITQNVKALVN